MQNGVDEMTRKRKIQNVIDILMAVLLPVLMAYSLIGEDIHEWTGIIMFALFVCHNGLNRKWYKNLFWGKYNGVRILGTIINILILFLMLLLMTSGIAMSRHAVPFLAVQERISLARNVHLVASYWCYTLTSVHLGLHGAMVMGMMRKVFHIEKASRIRSIILRVFVILLSAYGIHAFIQRGFGDYMLLRNEFVFFDFSEPLIFFFMDYLAIMALFAFVGYYTTKALQTKKFTK